MWIIVTDTNKKITSGLIYPHNHFLMFPKVICFLGRIAEKEILKYLFKQHIILRDTDLLF